MAVKVFDRMPRRDAGVAGNRTPDDWQVLTRSSKARTPSKPGLSRRRVPS